MVTTEKAIASLLRIKTINLGELATGFSSNAKTESSCKRLQRLLNARANHRKMTVRTHPLFRHFDA